MSDLLEEIKLHRPLDKDSFEIKDVERDGNCCCRTLSVIEEINKNEEKYNKKSSKLYH